MLSVTELNEQAKALLESTFSYIEVTGEISRLTKNASSGHWYFTLKDEKSAISCAIFKFANNKLKFELKESMKVVVVAKVTIFVPSGGYQLVVSNLRIDGEGELELAFRQLKERLANEGLFDISHKKSLPKFPKKVAIITSITSAAYQDMLRVASDRYRLCKFDIYNSLMQGDMAVNSVIKAIKKADGKGYCAIIIARGGGSKEDLWCFNDEALAREIYVAKTPIISAIGHEIDFSISDFVSDHRSLTPTAAMVDLLPDTMTILQSFDGYYELLNSFLNAEFLKDENLLKMLSLNLKSRATQEKIQLLFANLQNLKFQFQSILNAKFLKFDHNLRDKEIIFREKEQFYNKSKTLIQIRKDGKNISLERLKSGDDIELVSQTSQKKAIIQ